MKTEFQFRLLDLPNELVAHIIEQVDNIKALRKLARTCHRIQDLTEPVLYRSVLARSGSRTEAVLQSIQTRVARAAGIHHLDLPCDYHQDQNFDAVESLIRRARNLKSLMVESPECNNGDFEAEQVWNDMTNHIFLPFRDAAISTTEASSRPLQNLRELTLNLNGSDSPYWTLAGYSTAILEHPTLRCLKISCVNILDSLEEEVSNKPKTQLKHLELEECNITHKGLRSILSLPEALETLYLGENIHNIRHFIDEVDPTSNHLFQTDSKAAIEAIQQHQHSLKHLTYVTTDTYYQHMQLAYRITSGGSSADAGFANFHCLEDVTLVGHCPNFERALMTSQSPPNLRRIECRGLNPLRQTGGTAPGVNSVPFLRAPSCSMPPNLKDLDIVFETTFMSFGSADSAKKKLIETAAEAVHKTGIKLRVFYLQVTGYFPPYLYGEPRPSRDLVYAEDGFVGRLALVRPTRATQILGEDEESDSDWEDTSTEDEEEEYGGSG